MQKDFLQKKKQKKQGYANEGPLGRYNFLHQIMPVFYCLPKMIGLNIEWNGKESYLTHTEWPKIIIF